MVFPDGCEGCGWRTSVECMVIKAPKKMWKGNKECFARATPLRALQIQKECDSYIQKGYQHKSDGLEEVRQCMK